MTAMMTAADLVPTDQAAGDQPGKAAGARQPVELAVPAEAFRHVAEPQGAVRVTWRTNPGRYLDNTEYRTAVRAIVRRHIYGATSDDAFVLSDDAGTRVLAARTMFHPDGSFHRDPRTGRVCSELDIAALDPTEELP